MVIDIYLKFHGHAHNVAQKAGGLALNLCHSTVCSSPDFMVTLFTLHVHPIIDYCSSVWNVGYIQDIQIIETIQRHWTKCVTGLGDMECGQRLKSLGLFPPMVDT